MLTEQARSNDNFVEQLAIAARMEAAGLRGSFKNRAFSTGSTALTGANAPTNSTTVNLLAAQLNARTSGIFLAFCTFSVTGLTAADTFTTIATTQTGMALSTATKIGPAGAGNALGQVTTNGAYISNVAGGITITGGTVAVTQYTSGARVLPTAGTTIHFSWAGIIQNSVTATSEAPFTLNSQVALVVSVNSANSSSGTYTGLTIGLMELA